MDDSRRFQHTVIAFRGMGGASVAVAHADGLGAAQPSANQPDTAPEKVAVLESSATAPLPAYERAGL